MEGVSKTYNVWSQVDGGQPSNLGPSAMDVPSLQQPYRDSSHVFVV